MQINRIESVYRFGEVSLSIGGFRVGNEFGEFYAIAGQIRNIDSNSPRLTPLRPRTLRERKVFAALAVQRMHGFAHEMYLRF